MADLIMPQPRDYGWALKPTSSTRFQIHQRPNGQFSVVLNHALLRGVTAEMIHWWFLHFPKLRVMLTDVAGYQQTTVPGYLLWHPSDHVDATLHGTLGPGGTARRGARIHIQEVMQYDRYGLRFPVDSDLSIFYCDGDGWAMGKTLPLIGKVMCLRIHYHDVIESGAHLGVHYHYEIVIGASGNTPISRFINRRLAGHYPPEFFDAWHLHNTIEVGTFENFLPALHAQRDAASPVFERDMDAARTYARDQTAFGAALFQQRMAYMIAADDPYEVQGAERPSFL